MDWKDVEDSADHYSITILADYPGIEYPVKTDVTLRRVQKFKTKPGEKLSVRVGDAEPANVQAGADGRISVPNITIPSKDGVRIGIRRL